MFIGNNKYISLMGIGPCFKRVQPTTGALLHVFGGKTLVYFSLVHCYEIHVCLIETRVFTIFNINFPLYQIIRCRHCLNLLSASRIYI